MPDASSPRRTAPRATLAVLVAALLAYLSFPAVWGWNENSRLALAMAMVDRGTLAIDAYRLRPGLETEDASIRDGHRYSDKAIGTALLGAPAYALARPLLARFEGTPERHAAFARTVVAWAAVSVPAATSVALLFAFVHRASGHAGTASLVAASAALGTPLWPFATVLFGHATAAALLFAAFVAARAIRESRGPAVATAAACGSALGLAAITEYPTAPLAGLIGLYLLLALRSLPRATQVRAVAAAATAAAVPLALLLAYNTVAFGSPLTLSYARIAAPEFAQVHAQGLLGVGLPRPERFAYLTVHPVRGLFVQSPVLLAGLAGLVPMWRRGWRAEAVLIGSAFAVLLAINAGFPVWWGGSSAVARHMVPATLLLAVPIAFLGPRGRAVAAALALVSAAQMAVATLVAPTVVFDDTALTRRLAEGPLPWTGTSPLWNEGWTALRAGELRAMLGVQLGLPRGAFLAGLALTVAGLFAWAARAGSRGGGGNEPSGSPPHAAPPGPRAHET